LSEWQGGTRSFLRYRKTVNTHISYLYDDAENDAAADDAVLDTVCSSEMPGEMQRYSIVAVVTSPTGISVRQTPHIHHPQRHHFVRFQSHLNSCQVVN
jgi:hypothetical protein